MQSGFSVLMRSSTIIGPLVHLIFKLGSGDFEVKSNKIAAGHRKQVSLERGGLWAGQSARAGEGARPCTVSLRLQVFLGAVQNVFFHVRGPILLSQLSEFLPESCIENPADFVVNLNQVKLM